MTPWTTAHKAPLFMGFPRQEYWSGLPFPALEDLPDPAVKAGSPAPGRFFFFYHWATKEAFSTLQKKQNQLRMQPQTLIHWSWPRIIQKLPSCTGEIHFLKGLIPAPQDTRLPLIRWWKPLRTGKPLLTPGSGSGPTNSSPTSHQCSGCHHTPGEDTVHAHFRSSSPTKAIGHT